MDFDYPKNQQVYMDPSLKALLIEIRGLMRETVDILLRIEEQLSSEKTP